MSWEGLTDDIAEMFAVCEGCIDVFAMPPGLRIDDRRYVSKAEAARERRARVKAARGELRCSACGCVLSGRGARRGVIVCPASGCWTENKAA